MDVRNIGQGAAYISPDHVSLHDPDQEFDEDKIVTGEMMELLQHIIGTNFSKAEHTRRTPERYVKMLRDLTTPDPFEFTVFDNTKGIDEMIILQKIPFYTLCAHHVIPFYGNADIAYIPGVSIAGLSKFVRVVRSMAKKLTVQEELTAEIADFLEAKLDPQGVAVVLRAEHMCMAMRGVQAPGIVTTTSAVRGVFADHSRTAKAEFMAVINA